MLERLRALFRLAPRHGLGRGAITMVAMTVAVVLSLGAAAAAPNAAIVVDHKTGKVLYSSNADAQRYPASLTKMMTLYMLFEAIESGQTKLDSRIKVSAFAAKQPPSKLGVKAGGTIAVKDAILALVTRSANDIATAVAEHLAGTESAFAQQMTNRARQLGMTKTTFRNAHGLPNTAQVTTARDMATLGRALQDHFPQHFHYFSTRSFTWNGQRIGNHNRVLGRVDGANGIKTGYTRASGFNLVTSVDSGGRQIVAVVIGGDTGKQRDDRMVSLVQTHLPKASRGARTAPLIARGKATQFVASVDIRVPTSKYPMPRLRPTTTVIAAAEAPMPIVVAEQPAALIVEPTPVAEEIAASTELPETATAFAATSVAQIIGANSIFALEAIEQEGDAGADDDFEFAAVEPPPPAVTPAVIDGWKIQIAATPTKSGAEELLDKARAAVPTTLADVSPYTEPVQAGNATLYRARFGGFASKDAAWAACNQLNKKNFNCLAISD